MAMTFGGITRTVALWIMMIGAGIATGLLYWQGQYVWAVFWSCIIGLVVGFELFGIITKKKTISTMYKEFIQAHKFWGYTILAILCVALNALIVHLAVW